VRRQGGRVALVELVLIFGLEESGDVGTIAVLSLTV
jgi:hypothetical protein